jgi:Cobalamin synthesis protein cobW C-terminal domain
MLLDGDLQREWKPQERRLSRLIFIGRNLKKDEITQGFLGCGRKRNIPVWPAAKRQKEELCLCTWILGDLNSTHGRFARMDRSMDKSSEDQKNQLVLNQPIMPNARMINLTTSSREAVRQLSKAVS